MIVYKKGNLLASPKGSILVHAVNCQGVWGAGVARDLKRGFPISFVYYNRSCEAMEPKRAGWALVLPQECGYRIGCLFTSVGYGYKKDNEKTILKNTEKALVHFMAYLEPEDQIYSPKFNSGLFGVKWERTAEVLERVIGNRLWNVVEL